LTKYQDTRKRWEIVHGTYLLIILPLTLPDDSEKKSVISGFLGLENFLQNIQNG